MHDDALPGANSQDEVDDLIARLICPECHAVGITRQAKTSTGLAGHRLHAHGVRGTSRASSFRHKHKPKPDRRTKKWRRKKKRELKRIQAQEQASA